MKQSYSEDNECPVRKHRQMLLKTVPYGERVQALDQTDRSSNLEFAALSNLFILIDPKFPELSKWG